MVLVVIVALRVSLQAARGKEWRPFVQALGESFGGLLPEHDIEEKRFFLPFAVAIAIRSVDRDALAQPG